MSRIGVVMLDGNILFQSEDSEQAWRAWKAAERVADALASQGRFSDRVACGFARMIADEKYRQAMANPGQWVTPALPEPNQTI